MQTFDESTDEEAFVWMVKNSVVPRPIAWVSTIDANGVGNLAPYSYFTLVTMYPPTLMISFIGQKDTLDNIEATGEFVVNMIAAGQAEVATASAAILPSHIDESELLGLTTSASTHIAPPRLADARVALECTLLQQTTVLDARVVFARVVAIHVDDGIIGADGRISYGAYNPVARLGGSLYTSVTNEYRHVVPVATPEWLAEQAGTDARLPTFRTP
ncbi:MAG: hypothetical protein JWR01_1195 [Subtercola sp.]|nr:hypothetical protein [Subtercola sp.]